MKNYDLIVVGGGTAGCAAAYIAGKNGLKTLLIEKNIHLGGTITSGLVIPVMNSGNNQINTEFYDALTTELHSIGGQVTYQGNQGWFNPELTKIALDSLMLKAGVEVLFNIVVQSVTLEDRVVKGVLIKSQSLLECNNAIDNVLSVTIGARYVIDSTGNCEIGKLCNCNFLENTSHQPTSLRFIMSGINLERFANWLRDFDADRGVTTVECINGAYHLSTAYTWDSGKKWALAPLFEDAVTKGVLQDTDRNYFQLFTIAGTNDSVGFNCPRIIDTSNKERDSRHDNENNTHEFDYSQSLITARQSILRLADFCKKYFVGFENAHISNIADMLGVRVSNRIKGKYIYTIEDLKSGKKFDNPVLISNYPIDVHSSARNSSTLEIVQEYQLPIESLMSDDIENLFVAGRCLSADFMAQGALRVQASCFSMGEGVAKFIIGKDNHF